MSRIVPNCRPGKSGGATPTMVNSAPFRRIRAPTMSARPLNRVCHRRWLMTTTGCAPGVTSSDAASSRPWLAVTPRRSKTLPVTMTPLTRSVSFSALRLAVMPPQAAAPSSCVAPSRSTALGRVGHDVPVRAVEDVVEAIALLDREPLQQCGVDQAEDRRVGADAEREREDRGGGEARVLAQHARGVNEALPGGGEQA